MKTEDETSIKKQCSCMVFKTMKIKANLSQELFFVTYMRICLCNEPFDLCCRVHFICGLLRNIEKTD